MLPRDGIKIQEGYHSPQVDVRIKLNTNESPEPPPKRFLEELSNQLETISWNRYPDRRAEKLSEAIANLHDLDIDNVFVANGSNEVLQTILLAYGGHKRLAAIFEPTYLLYGHICNLTSTNLISFERGEDFLISRATLDDLYRAKPDIIFICSPNNPTGMVENPEILREIIENAPGLVVIDEAYGQFSSFSAADFLDTHKSLIVVRTYSKTWALAGLRLGYALCDQEIANVLWETALPYHLDSFKQLVGRIALKDAEDMKERVGRFVQEREALSRRLIELGFTPAASQANFILFGSDLIDAKLLWKELLKREILIRDVTSFPKIGNKLRVTIGTHEENVCFLEALEAIVTSGVCRFRQ